MRMFAVVVAAALAMSGVANAHPGSKLLTTDSKTAPRAMTDGMSFEDVNGVHLFKGTPHRQDESLLGAEPVMCSDHRVVEIEIRGGQWRRLRRLRTQGFYSGVSYPSRPYTQGFYSGRR